MKKKNRKAETKGVQRKIKERSSKEEKGQLIMSYNRKFKQKIQ